MFQRYLTHVYAGWQIRRAIHLLNDPRSEIREQAAAQLRAVRPRCLRPLRRVAFRQRSVSAVHAAELLFDMGDAQGLYALLAQYSDRYLAAWYGHHLRAALQRVGSERILRVLEAGLDWIETSPLLREHWCLSLSVYALHALESLHSRVPLSLWRRALAAHAPGFEDLRACRSVVPSGEEWGKAPSTRDDNWRVGSTLVAVRRAAVDALLLLDREHAFELLREALAHSSPEVQITALYGLRHLRDPRAYVLLQPLAADRRHPLARDARRAIEAFGTRQPDALTLVRAATNQDAAPEELLRPAASSAETNPETLLRIVNEGGNRN